MNGERGIIALRRIEIGGPVTEAIVGLAALALAIIGLADVFPWLLASIATIALGAAFVFQAGMVAKRFSALARAEQAEGAEAMSAWGGLTVGFLAGCAGVALGILAILDIVPTVLVPTAIIAYGVALIMDSGTRVRLEQMEGEQAGLRGTSLRAARESASALSGIEVLIGLSAITLGILAIIKIAAPTMSLVAILAVGTAVVIFSSPVGRFFNFR